MKACFTLRTTNSKTILALFSSDICFVKGFMKVNYSDNLTGYIIQSTTFIHHPRNIKKYLMH